MFQLVFFCQGFLFLPVDFIFQSSFVIQFIFGALNLRVKPENTTTSLVTLLRATNPAFFLQQILINYFVWFYFPFSLADPVSKNQTNAYSIKIIRKTRRTFSSS